MDTASLYIVICKDDKGRYTQPTRKTFNTKDQAEHYAKGIALSRKAIVVEIPNDDDFAEGQ